MSATADPPPTPFGTLHLEHSSTTERAAEELRRAILDGELESGTPLREVAIAASLGISRPTVREALTMLVGEGLAHREPHRGVSVTAIDAESVRDVCRARWILEGAGVRRWARATAAQQHLMRDTLRLYTSAVHEGSSYRELNERHLAFHVALVGLTGSPRLVATANTLMLELKLALAQVERIRRDAHDEAESHTALMALLDEDRVDEAVEFLRDHLANAERSIIDALGL